MLHVFCYVDDTVHGDPTADVDQFTGWCLAIDGDSQARNIEKLRADRSGLAPLKYRAQWQHQISVHYGRLYVVRRMIDDQRPLAR